MLKNAMVLAPKVQRLACIVIGIGVGMIAWANICRMDTASLKAEGYGLKFAYEGVRQEKEGALIALEAQAALVEKLAKANP
jgi:hypothetical protein